jgi:hypothetical protein
MVAQRSPLFTRRVRKGREGNSGESETSAVVCSIQTVFHSRAVGFKTLRLDDPSGQNVFILAFLQPRI